MHRSFPTNQIGSDLVADRIFQQLPLGELAKWLPFHNFLIVFIGHSIVVKFRSLECIKSVWGNVYFAPHRPQIVIDGQNAIIAWSTHSIERICERLVPGWKSHMGLLDVFEILYECRWFDPCELLW